MDGPSRLSDGVFPYLTSALDEEDDAAAVSATPAVNSRPIKRTNRQTSFQEEATVIPPSYRGSLAAKCQLSLLAAGN